MEQANIIWSFLVAALLGFLIGLERERKRETSGSIFAGIRTFPLMALFGAVSGQLAQLTNILVVGVSLAVFGALLIPAYWRASSGAKIGGTSEIAALVTFGLGVVAGLNYFVAALAGAVIATALLSLKEELHTFAGALNRADLFAVVQFAAVSLVILPLVPNASYGPWGVWNPNRIWLLVVLISGISFVGYVTAKLIGARRGIGLSGLVGGLASSTAVTLSFTERSKANPVLSMILAVGVLAASAVMIPRLLVILAVVQPNLVIPVLLPFGTLWLVTTIGALIIYRRSQRQSVEGAELNNPFELKSALQFALLFALILLLAKAAEELLGERGVYGVSALGGLAQMDAITLALAGQVKNGLDVAVAAKGLALAAASNSLFKAGLALTLGSRIFGQAILLTMLVAAVAAVATAWFLPVLSFTF